MKKTKSLKFDSFLGISLSGAKNDRTSVCAVDYYNSQNRLVVSLLIKGIGPQKTDSSDEVILDLLKKQKKVKLVGFDVPLQLPKCIRCRLKCPGYSQCEESSIQWLWKQHNKIKEVKKNHKIFTPYTERCVEHYLATEVDSGYTLASSLGANAAPLTARAQYLLKHIKTKSIEVLPSLSLWRIGRGLQIHPMYLKFSPLSDEADNCRYQFLKVFSDINNMFIYNQDIQVMIESPQAFHAFLVAITTFLESQGQTVRKPVGFPRGESWVSFPVEGFSLFPS